MTKSTCLVYKDIHKGTWKITSTRIVNQRDRGCIKETSDIDVRSARPNCDSGHYFVKDLVRERLENVGCYKRPKSAQWDVEKLQQRGFITQNQDTLGKKLKVISQNLIVHDSVERKWKDVKKIIG